MNISKLSYSKKTDRNIIFNNSSEGKSDHHVQPLTLELWQHPPLLSIYTLNFDEQAAGIVHGANHSVKQEQADYFIHLKQEIKRRNKPSAYFPNY